MVTISLSDKSVMCTCTILTKLFTLSYSTGDQCIIIVLMMAEEYEELIMFCASVCGMDHLVMGKLSESIHYGQLLVMTEKRYGSKTSE